MTRILIALAATVALSTGAFAQATEEAFTMSCADYNAATDEMKMQSAAAFNAALLESNSASQQIGETKGPKDDAQRMDNISAACAANPNGSVFQAVEQQNTGNG